MSNNYEQIENSRIGEWPVPDEELFELVWSMPVSKVGSMFGISNNAVKQRCAKRNIPVPEPGYWQKQKAKDNRKNRASYKHYNDGTRIKEWPPTDEQLQELVWKIPLPQIAILFNISYSKVWRRCKSRNIKKPPNGYF